MRKLAALLLVLLLSGAGYSSPSVAHLVIQSAAMVEVNGAFICSGVFVGEGLVLTAAHCISKDLSVYDSRGVRLSGSVERVDKSLDLALVRAVGAVGRVARVECCPVVGEDVVASGFPYGVRAVSFGKVEALFVTVFKNEAFGYRTAEYILSNYTGGSGLSGGGVYRPTGEVVGIHLRSFYVDGPGGTPVRVWSGAISSREVVKFLEVLK